MPSPGDKASAARPAAVNRDRVRYTDAAPLIEVMFDQLEYLIAHLRPDCGPGCPECARLEQVRNSLLAPFNSVPGDTSQS